MKVRSQKLISLILVLVMLVTMIPAGIFTANAEGSIIEIGTPEKWNEEASKGSTFEGITVKLTADLDFENGALTPLAATFKGVFDGNGKTIKNATVAGTGVIANELYGGATVQNVKLVNVDVTASADAGMIAGTFVSPESDETTNLSYISIDATSSVSATSANAGGLIGVVAKHKKYTLAFSNLSLKMSVSGSKTGGLIGVESGARNYTNYAYITVTNALIAPTTTVTGGVFGAYGARTLPNGTPSNAAGNNLPASHAQYSSVTLNNVVVCADKLFGSTGDYLLWGENLFVTSGNITASASGFSNYYNGIHVARSLTVDAYTSAANITEGLPTVITAAVGMASAKYNDDGFVTSVVLTDPTTCVHASWFDWETVTPATKNEMGLEMRTCKNCNKEETRAIPALGYTVAEFLADVENISAVNVTSKDDWAALSAWALADANNTFEGKTVLLANDISGITAPLADTFKGTFYGNGHTISDSAVSGKGVIANTLYGGATVQNVKFVNVDVTSTAEAGMIAGTFVSPESHETTKLSYISIDATSSVAATSSNAGGLIGVVAKHKNYTLAFSNLSLKMSVSGSKTGGLIGVESGARSYTAYAYITVTNALIAPTTTVTGGVFGAYGSRTLPSGSVGGNLPASHAQYSSVTLNNVVVCADKLFGSAGDYLLWGENLFVTSGNISASAGGFANYYNGIHVGRNLTVATYTSAASITENLPKVVTLAVAKASAKYDTNGFVTHIVETDPSTCNHTWSEYVTITPATKGEAGLEMRTCTNCNKEETREIPALGYTVEDFLDDYANQTTCTIMTVEDWKAIAASGRDFNGKTIQLGKDIDFNYETAPTLVPFTTTVKFNGQGYKIMNVGSDNNPQTVPLIATAVTSAGTNTTNPSSEYDLDFSDEMVNPSSVKNVTFENVTMKAEGNIALVAIEMTVTSKQSYVFENILVKNCDITSTSETGVVAAILANHNRGSSSWVRSIITFTNITLDKDTTITGSTHVAGLLASMSGSTHSAYGAKNIYVAATLTSTHVFEEATDANRVTNQQSTTVGGLFGKMTGTSGRPCSMLIEDCAIVGSLIIENANHAHHGALGAVFGYANMGNDKFPGISLKNVVVDLVEYSDAMTYLAGFGVVQNSTGFVLSYVDCYVGKAPTNEIYQVYQVCYINSKVEENLLPKSTQRNFADVATISTGTAGDYIHFDEKGYISYVEDHFYALAYQPGNNGTAIRFIAVAQVPEATDVKMHVTARFTDATGGGKRFTTTCELLDLLNVYGEYGITEEKSASDLGGKKLIALTIYNIPTGRPITFTVTTSYLNQYGVTVQSQTALTVVCNAAGVVTDSTVMPIN